MLILEHVCILLFKHIIKRHGCSKTKGGLLSPQLFDNSII